MTKPDNNNTVCRNCQTQLSGSYCSACGQKEGDRDIYFSDLAGELLGDVFVWETSIWKTLVPLLIRPGFLSKEYFLGRKARYLPPLRLYLVLSFIMFLLVSLNSGNSAITVEADRGSQRNQQASDGMSSVDGRTDDLAAKFDFWEPDKKPAWAIDLEQRLQTNITSIAENPRLFLDNFIERLPYLMFLLLPLFAVLIKLTYLFSPFHYLQHLIFSLHYHSAIFLFFTFGIILNALTDYEFGLWILPWYLIYLPLALAKAYDSSYASALGKSLLIAMGETILLIVALSILAVISVMTL